MSNRAQYKKTPAPGTGVTAPSDAWPVDGLALAAGVYCIEAPGDEYGWGEIVTVLEEYNLMLLRNGDLVLTDMDGLPHRRWRASNIAHLRQAWERI